MSSLTATFSLTSAFEFLSSGYFLLLLFLPFFGFLLAFFGQTFFSNLGAYFSRSPAYYRATVVAVTAICSGTVVVSLMSSVALLFWTTGQQPSTLIVHLEPSANYGWIEVDYFFQNFSFQFDPLSSVMLFVITSISFLVHMYSYAYLGFDPFYMRFISFLNLFTFFMMLLVSSGNAIQLFVGWEGVGLSSYLLINFWHTRLEANKSAIKAIALNRVGDVALLLSVVVFIYAFGTTSHLEIFTIVQNLTQENAPFFELFGVEVGVISVSTWLLLIAAVAKSAQLGLHTWLPDAMEGPTPVSALLHAATMVTAGVYLVVRFSYLFELVPSARNFCVVIGSLTAFFGSLTALVQFDIKKIIAFSTTSQLGYMFIACGLSGYHIAMYHLVTHAFFKALLFLTAGVIIHNLNNEQDIRRMGRLITFAPLTYLFMVSGFLSLSGAPFLGGFFSKDAIIELAWSGSSYFSLYAFVFALAAAFLTACYSVRVLYYVFFSNLRISPCYRISEVSPYFMARDRLLKSESYTSLFVPFAEPKQRVHDISLYNFLVLLPLFFGTIFAGYLLYDSFVGIGSVFWADSIFFANSYNTIFYEFFVPGAIKLLPIGATFSGYLLTFYLYNQRGKSVDRFFSALYLRGMFKAFFQNLFRRLYTFLVKRWFFDVVYNKFLVTSFLGLSRAIYLKVDKGYLEYFGPYGLSRFFSLLASVAGKVHSRFELYILLLLSSLFLIVIIFWFLLP